MESQRVSFGTSGHRGSAPASTFNEAHILAVTQAVCDVRRAAGVTGPLFMGKDTHALSEPAFRTALEVLTANNIQVRIQKNGSPTPTPAISHAIISWNRGRESGFADGIVITPSHNPPADGGFKYNPPHGGPADTSETSRIEDRANALMAENNRGVHRQSLHSAYASGLIVDHDYITQYASDLAQVIDLAAIAASGLRLAADPLGGASLPFWEPIAERYKLNLTLVNKELDPTFRFVPHDRDGKIRMDCSSPYAMGQLLRLKDSYDLAFACDPDADRHGIVTPAGLMNPNHYLSTVVNYLFTHRPGWPKNAAVGKTVVTSAMLDRVAAHLHKDVLEVPVGFKWFVPGLSSGSCGLGCEESAGASFLCLNGQPWSTDKDGLLLGLLAAEMTAVCKKNPAEQYQELTTAFGAPLYERLDSPADAATRKALKAAGPDSIKQKTLAGAPITQILTHAPGNNAPIGGIKVITPDGWFAARPSGTEDVCKVYTEGFKGAEHFQKLQTEALALVASLLG